MGEMQRKCNVIQSSSDFYRSICLFVEEGLLADTSKSAYFDVGKERQLNLLGNMGYNSFVGKVFFFVDFLVYYIFFCTFAHVIYYKSITVYKNNYLYNY